MFTSIQHNIGWFNISQLGFDRWTLLLGVDSRFLAFSKAKHYGVPSPIFLGGAI
jgi:hypothetical protein